MSEATSDAKPDATKICPVCGETILTVARKCRHCGEYLDPTARPRDAGPDATERMLLPVGRPGSAIAAGYLGLFALFPLIGLIAGAFAITFGVMALKQIGRDPSLSGKGRAWFGIIAGAIGMVLWGLLVATLVAGAMFESQR